MNLVWNLIFLSKISAHRLTTRFFHPFQNDAAVMEAWAKDQKTGLSLLQLMGDPKVGLSCRIDRFPWRAVRVHVILTNILDNFVELTTKLAQNTRRVTSPRR